jgi:hypothetical protein
MGKRLDRWNPELTAAVKLEFLDALRHFGQLGQAADACRVSRRTVLAWQKGDEKFRRDYNAVITEVVEELEGNMLNLARQVPELLANIGNPKGFSASALHTASSATMFLLKAHKPELYRDTYKWNPKERADMDALTSEEINKLAEQLGDDGGAVQKEPALVHSLGHGEDSSRPS